MALVTVEASVVDDARRLVPLDAVHNFRDLGGYPVGDGRTTAWGRLFRADGLHRLSESDLDVLDGLGIRTVIDLRSSKELDDHGAFPVARYPVSFHHLPIIDATWMAESVPTFDDTEQGAIDFLTWAYRDMVEQGADRFAHAITLMTVPEVAPIVFHCAAGKDRTGILAALVLAGLGVDDEIIAADYALTQEAMIRMRTWVESNSPEMATRMHDAPSYMMQARPEAILALLAELRADHGSIRDFLSAIGVGTSQLDLLVATLTV